ATNRYPSAPWPTVGGRVCHAWQRVDPDRLITPACGQVVGVAHPSDGWTPLDSDAIRGRRDELPGRTLPRVIEAPAVENAARAIDGVAGVGEVIDSIGVVRPHRDNRGRSFETASPRREGGWGGSRRDPRKCRPWAPGARRDD